MGRFSGFKLFISVTILAFIITYGLTTWGPSHNWQPSASSLQATVDKSFEQLEILKPSEEPFRFEYIEITDGCGPYYNEACVNVRSGPGKEYPIVEKLRTGMVLKVAEKIIQGEHSWYKISFDKEIRYPDRIKEDWYVSADYAHSFQDEGSRETTDGVNTSSTKRIVVYRSKQMLYAYENGELFMKQSISTGLELTPTPRGNFFVYRKTPTRYMQGPLPGISEQEYDLPGVPWDLYFTYQGGAIHGAYWHNKFGEPWSHGCVNMPPEEAHKLYDWAELGTEVIVRD